MYDGQTAHHVGKMIQDIKKKHVIEGSKFF